MPQIGARSGMIPGRHARRAVLWMAALAAQVSGAAACACPVPHPTLEDLIGRGPETVVVAGRVVSILSPDRNGPTVTRIAVEDVIKGEAPDVIELVGATARDDRCGVDFRVGEVRTLAAARRPDGRWSTNVCLVPEP
jgi:hypothetical protein